MIKKSMITSLLVCTFATTAFAFHVPEGTYSIDPDHSRVAFDIPHLVVSSVEGRFDTFTGQIIVEKDNVMVNADIDINSIKTGNDRRDGHLKSPDFFDAAQYPKMTFQSKKTIWKKNNFKLIGDLTLHGVTKEVTLNGKYLGTVKDQYGNDRTAATAEAKINRKDFGLNWGKMVEAGPIVGDDVTLLFKIEGIKNK